MKSVLFTAVALFASTSAFAGQKSTVLVSELDRWNIDPALMSNEDVTGGDVVIDRKAKEATLTLYRRFYCPEGMICAQVMPAPFQTDALKIVSIKKNVCGALVFTAKRDLRPVDGGLEILEITDNTKNFCKTLIALPPTAVTYFTSYYNHIEGKETETRSTFEGQRLQKLVRE